MGIAFAVITVTSCMIFSPALAEDRVEGPSGGRDNAGAPEVAAPRMGAVSTTTFGNRWSLDLNHLTTLSRDSAEDLARQQVGSLLLDGLTSISAEQAAALARHRGRRLSLRGVQTLTEEAAAELAHYRGALLLDGVTQLSESAVVALARCQGPLSLTGLTSLSVPGAAALASRQMPGLSLDALTDVSVDVAAELSRHRGPLRLDGLTVLSEDVARTLAAHESELSLAALKALSVDAAVSLARHRGGLSLDGLKALSPPVASALAQYGDAIGPSRATSRGASPLERAFGQVQARAGQTGLLTLRSLHTLDSPPLAQKLVTQERLRYARRDDIPILRLDSLASVSDEALVILTGFPGTLSLSGLTTLSPHTARKLVQHRGGLQLNGLTRLSPDAAEILSHYGEPLFLDEFNAYLGSAIRFYGGQSETAQRAENQLVLHGLRVLDSASLADTLVVQEEQRARRHYDDPTLRLDRLIELSDTAAAALAAFKGTLCLNGMRELSLTSAQALAHHRGRLELNGLRRVSDEIAVELARHQGDLSLRGAQTVSAMATHALRANARISLPAAIPVSGEDHAAADDSPLSHR